MRGCVDVVALDFPGFFVLPIFRRSSAYLSSLRNDHNASEQRPPAALRHDKRDGSGQAPGILRRNHGLIEEFGSRRKGEGRGGSFGNIFRDSQKKSLKSGIDRVGG